VVRSDGGRAAPRGWCALLLSFYGLTLLQPFRTTPAVARGHGFPSLFKEGSLWDRVARQKPALVRWDSYCCQFFSMMVSS